MCDESRILDALKYKRNKCGALCSTCAAHAKMEVCDEAPIRHMNMLTLARSVETEIDFMNMKSCALIYAMCTQTPHIQACHACMHA